MLTAIITIVGTGGAAWASVRTALNGTRERVARMEVRQDAHGRTLDKVVVGQARMEEQLKVISAHAS